MFKDLCRPASTKRMLAAALCVIVVLSAMALAGCSKKSSGTPAKPKDDRTGYGMGGVNQQIVVSKSTFFNKPAEADLSTPESAVRSYLDWVSYAYRIGESAAATKTMTPYQEVRVDAYTQMNLQKERLLDQNLNDITFGPVSKDGTHTLLPAKESWSYRYVSISVADKTLSGPYKASYETTYSLVKTKAGWLVDSIDVKAVGTVK